MITEETLENMEFVINLHEMTSDNVVVLKRLQEIQKDIKKQFILNNHKLF